MAPCLSKRPVSDSIVFWWFCIERTMTYCLPGKRVLPLSYLHIFQKELFPWNEPSYLRNNNTCVNISFVNADIHPSLHLNVRHAFQYRELFWCPTHCAKPCICAVVDGIGNPCCLGAHGWDMTYEVRLEEHLPRISGRCEW